MRLLLVADLGFLALEQLGVVLLAQALFPQVRALWPAAAALLGTTSLLWSAVFFRLGAPLKETKHRAPQAARLMPRSREHAAYRAAVRMPMDSLWLRVVLVTSASALLGFYGVQESGLSAQGAAFLLWAAAFVTPLIDAWRALIHEQAGRRRLRKLLATGLSLRVPSTSPVELQFGYLLDTYQSRLLLSSLGLLGAALALFAGVVALSLPGVRSAAASAVPLPRILFWSPPLGIGLLALGMAGFRRCVRPLEAWSARLHAAGDLLAQGPTQPSSGMAEPALRAVEALPRWLTLGKLAGLLLGVLAYAAVICLVWQISPRAVALLFGELALCLLAAACVEWPWQTTLLAPLLPSIPSLMRLRRAIPARALLLGAAGLPLLLLTALSGAFLLKLPGSLPRIVGLLLGPLGLLAVAGLWLWLGRVLRPLAALTAEAEALARGTAEAAIHLEVPQPGAYIHLGQALAAMREALAERLQSTTQAQARLEAEAAERTAELRRRNQELEQALKLLGEAQEALLHAEKMASIGRLVAGIAHEINNPINAVINTANPLQETLRDIASGATADASLARDARAMLSVLDRGSRRAQEIVLALSNYAQGGSDAPARVDIHRILDESLELLQHPFKPAVEVVRCYRASGPVMSLGGQLLQVFINLLSNALHALAGRAFAEPAPRLEISTFEDLDKRQLHVAVRDNGPGIAESVLPRIFDPFFTTRDATQGSGLGLSIVHGIVARHRGQIRVETALGQGTCFTVILPLPEP